MKTNIRTKISAEGIRYMRTFCISFWLLDFNQIKFNLHKSNSQVENKKFFEKKGTYGPKVHLLINKLEV